MKKVAVVCWLEMGGGWVKGWGGWVMGGGGGKGWVEGWVKGVLGTNLLEWVTVEEETA